MTATFDRTVAVEQALAVLGNTSKRVADMLRLYGITGYKSTVLSCPVAVYLHNVTGIRWQVDTGVIERDDEPGIEITIPDAVTEFICDFDNSEYPDLIKPNLIKPQPAFPGDDEDDD